jgi:hypothetical protein
MTPKARLCLAAGILLALLPAVARPAPPAFPEGRWTLVRQTYGRGDANLAAPENPPHLEFLRDGSGWSARIWAGEATEQALPWPAWIAEGEALPLVVESWKVDPAAGTVEVRYRVKPSAGDDVVLAVVEAYELTEDGEALVGTLTATFLDGDETRGSFVLNRRFERKP